MGQSTAREIMSMTGLKFREAKAVYDLAKKPPDTCQQIRFPDGKRSMSAQEAERVVKAARERIALVDEGG